MKKEIPAEMMKYMKKEMKEEKKEKKMKSGGLKKCLKK